MTRIAPEHSHKPRERPSKPKKAPRLKRSGALRNLFKGPNQHKIHPKDAKVGRPESPRAKRYRRDTQERVEKHKNTARQIDVVDKMTTPVRKAVDKMKRLLK